MDRAVMTLSEPQKMNFKNNIEQDVTANGDRNEYNHKNPDYYSVFTGCDCIL